MRLTDPSGLGSLKYPLIPILRRHDQDDSLNTKAGIIPHMLAGRARKPENTKLLRQADVIDLPVEKDKELPMP